MANSSRKSVLDMTNEEARAFFLKNKSFCNFDLPDYFDFSGILSKIMDIMIGVKEDSDFYSKKSLKECESTNHRLLSNKDGKLSWRPLQVINPFLYVLLVKEITKPMNWEKILNRFSDFRRNEKIQCFSIPVEAKSNQSDKAEQVMQWWEKMEQDSISQSLKYKLSYDTDISDCYGSIYTHSIAWAIETMGRAKRNKGSKILGNKIDSLIRDMQYGQTNSIPQGSVLMDFIAEIILGYIDQQLGKKIKGKCKKYQIFRYRDDYRIFVNSQRDGELILKELSQTLIPYGLKLNSAKTKENINIISSALKPDKFASFNIVKGLGLQKELLLLHQHSIAYPNSGSIAKRIVVLNKRISKISSLPKKKLKKRVKKKIEKWKLMIKQQATQLIAIVVDIMLHNPKVIPISCSIISKLFQYLEDKKKKEISEQIYNRLIKSPNSELAQIWLQRMLKTEISKFHFKEPLCKIVEGEEINIWDNSWITSDEIKKLVNSSLAFNKEVFDSMDAIISDEEVNLFTGWYY